MTGEVSSGARLRQIVDILKKHNVIAGMTPEKLCSILEDLGPTFVKLGQIMSMRPDMIPMEYCEELQKLRTNAMPMPPDEVRRVVEGALQLPLERAFPSFDFTPLGSASIAQAHKAVLPTGEHVVVKVQREGIHDKMESDIALLRKAADVLKYTPSGETIDFNMMLDEMWVVSQEEMNFITEARNIEEFHRLNADIAYVACPKVYRELCTGQLLVMEEIDGIKIDNLEALEKSGYDNEEIAKKLCVNYFKQIFDDGFFHADPHPGNILIRDGQIVWIDLGMIGRLSVKDQEVFKKAAMAAISKNTSEMVEAVLRIGKHTKPINREELFADVDEMLNEYMDVSLEDMDLGRMAQQFMDLGKKHRISMPSGVTMLGRGLMTIQGVVADVCPSISLMGLLGQHVADETFKNIDWKKTLAFSLKTVHESAHKSLSIPALLTDTLRAIEKGEFKMRVEQTRSPEQERSHERHIMQAANTAILCAGVLGSSLMCLANIEPRVAGVPWIAVAGFVATGGYGLWQYFIARKETSGITKPKW